MQLHFQLLATEIKSAFPLLLVVAATDADADADADAAAADDEVDDTEGVGVEDS